MVGENLKNAEPLHSIAIPGNPSLATRHRWRLSGVLAKNGRRVKLECWRVGGKLLTTSEAIDRFIVALSASPDDAPAEDCPTGAERRRRAHEAAAALEEMGA